VSIWLGAARYALIGIAAIALMTPSPRTVSDYPVRRGGVSCNSAPSRNPGIRGNPSFAGPVVLRPGSF
jgi:hypothetical protein